MAATDRQKQRLDQRVQDAPLLVGQLVYLRDQDGRSRHKIHDLWRSVVYQVVRDLWKAIVRPDADISPARAPPPPPHAWAAMDNDYSSDGNLWLLVSETAFLLSAAVPVASWLPSRDPCLSQHNLEHGRPLHLQLTSQVPVNGHCIIWVTSQLASTPVSTISHFLPATWAMWPVSTQTLCLVLSLSFSGLGLCPRFAFRPSSCEQCKIGG